jgi:hypothetical protein
MHHFIWLKGSETGQGNPQMDMQWSMPPRGHILPPPQPGMGYWPPPPWGYPTHPMGPWGRPPWPTQSLPSPAVRSRFMLLATCSLCNKLAFFFRTTPLLLVSCDANTLG